MSTLTAKLPPRAIFPSDPVYSLTVDNYHDMIRAGILTADDRVELLDGALICKTAKNPPHRTANLKLQRALTPLLPAGFFPQYQEPISLSRSEPEPDASIIEGMIEQFEDHHPTADHTRLVMEVSDSTIRQDRGIKQSIYSDSGIAVYWIINLLDRVIEVYTDPDSASEKPHYQNMTQYKSGELVPVCLRGKSIGEIAVDDILP